MLGPELAAPLRAAPTAAPTTTPTPTTTTASKLAALASPALTKAAPEVASGDFSLRPPTASGPLAQPVAKPSTFDPATSRALDAETTETNKLFANADGSRTQVLSLQPVRYRDDSGPGVTST